MFVRIRVLGLVLIAVLSIAPATGQDVFETLRSLVIENSGSVVRPSPPVAPQIIDADLLEVQHMLAARGYDVGVPDGVMGPRTRRAITSFQLSLGGVPTGVLTPAERSSLAGGGAIALPAAQSPNETTQPAQSGFELLYDLDLPGNDFRSGMSEPSLKNGTLESCMAACSADGMCQAFTYNAKARVCFLKAGFATQSYFSGAISGVRGQGANGMAFAPLPGTGVSNPGRPLTAPEIAQLQRALTALGYDAGTPDGVIGGRTRTAIADYIADHPGRARPSIDVALLETVTGVNPSAPASATIDPSTYRTLDEIDRDLGLIALARDPAILDAQDRVRAWFNRDRRQPGFDAEFVPAARYDRANAVEKDVILAEYRQILLDEAQAFVADPGNLSFRIRLTDYASFGDFVPGKGLALSTNIELLNRKIFSHRSFAVDRTFGGLALDAPRIEAIPLADEAAASALLDAVAERSGNRMSNITVWATISEIGVDRNATGTPMDADIPVTISVDKVSLMTFGRDGRAQGDELAVLYVPQGQHRENATASLSNTAIAARFGLPVLQGHIATTGGNSGHNIAYAMGLNSDFSENLASLLNLIVVRLHPEAVGQWLLEPGLRQAMSEDQHLRVYGKARGEYITFANEFDRRRALTLLSSQVLPELVASAPTLPIDIVSITAVEVGEYDFATRSFPLSHSTANVVNLPSNLGRLHATARYRDLPTSLSMSEAQAEAMVRAAPYGQPVLYMASFGTLALPAPGAVPPNDGQQDPSPGISLVFTPTRTALFADARLNVSLVEIDSALVVEDPDAPLPPGPPSESQLALADVRIATQIEMLGNIYDQLMEKGDASAIIQSSRAVREANEFDVAERRREAEAALQRAERAPIWLQGLMTFGTYQTERGIFGGAEIRFYSPPDEGFSANFHFSLLDPRQLTDLPVPLEAARTIAETPERTMTVLAQVDFIDVSTDGSSGTPSYQIALDIKDMRILTATGENWGSETLIARIDPNTAPKEKMAEASAPPLHELGPEALDYLRLQFAPDTMTEADHERMMLVRWVLERGTQLPAEEKFFPDGTDLTSPEVRRRWLPEFQNWAQGRLASLTAPLRLSCTQAISGDFWNSSLRAPAEAAFSDLAAAMPIDRIAARYSAPHLTGPLFFEIPGYFMEDSTCFSNAYSLAADLGLAADHRSGAVIRIDNAALPGSTSSLALDVIVEKVELSPHPQGGRPVILISARFDSAWAPGNPPTLAIDAADLTALLEEADTLQAGALPEGWDIVGLKPGQTLEQADAIIREHMEVIAIFERQQGQRQTPYFRNEMSYLDAKLSEAITLVTEPSPSGEIVYLIARQIGAPADTMPTEAVLAGLRSKYGPEFRGGEMGQGGFNLAWHSEKQPRSSRGASDLQHCGTPNVGAQGYWTPIEGGLDAVDPSVPENIQLRGYMVLPGPSDLYPETLELGALDCGVSLSASKSKSGNHDVLMVQMFDFVAYDRAIAEREATGDTASEAAAPTLDIKF